MTASIEDRSLRKQTGAIRRLDAAQARDIVAQFVRPVVGTDAQLAWDDDDSIVSATCGSVTLDRPADDGGSAAVVGTYKTHLYLDGLEHLTGRAATHLARHRGKLHFHGLTSVTDRVAAILATHAGASLSLRGLEQASPAGLAKHRANIGIMLPRRLRQPTPAGESP